MSSDKFNDACARFLEAERRAAVSQCALKAFLTSHPIKPKEKYKARRPDWHGIASKRFRWSRMRYQYGRYCYVIDPNGFKDYIWWEWL